MSVFNKKEWRYDIEYPFNPSTGKYDFYTYRTKVKIPGNGNRFENEWFIIEQDGTLKIKYLEKDGKILPYSHDGATIVPDFYCALKGAEFHDPIYQFAEEIAEVLGCSVFEVLRFGDKVFYERMQVYSSKVNPVPYVYYSGVTCLGYAFHEVAKFFRK